MTTTKKVKVITHISSSLQLSYNYKFIEKDYGILTLLTDMLKKFASIYMQDLTYHKTHTSLIVSQATPHPAHI